MMIVKRFKSIILFCVLLAASFSSFATHNRAGEIIYRYIGNGSTLTYEFTIITYTKLSGESGPADRSRLLIDYGDGTTDSIDRVSLVLIEGSEADFTDIYKNEYVGIHTYSGPFTYVVSFSDANRVADVINITGSVDIPFSVFDTLKILDPIFFGYNNSPILLQPPIDNAAIGIPFIHNPNAFDIDGDSLYYELIVPVQAPGIVVPGYAFPDQVNPGANNQISIDQNTGEITWDSPQRVGLYNIAILIREFRNGICIGTLIRDMQIRVEDTPNTPPIIEGPTEVCIIAGDTLEFTVTAYDNDAGQLVELSAAGSPFVVNISPATFPNNLVGNPVSGDFYWETVCEHLVNTNYQVIFRAEDDFDDFPLSTILTTVIRVLAPPPIDFTGVYNPSFEGVELEWAETYICEDLPLFRGYQVWRKVGCEGDPQDSCATDLAARGYELIATTTENEYIDFDFIRGNAYSYRVVARFAQLSSVGNIELNAFTGYPSLEFCVELPIEAPIMYNVDVRVTDETDGEIYVEWAKPRANDLDTTINPGPYRYILKRSDGIGSTANPTTLATFNSATFAGLIDTSFLDTDLNTVVRGYTYWIEFFVNGNFNQPLGIADPASSVFLTVTSRNLALDLNWDFSVPWVNDTFLIYRQDFQQGSFDLVDTVFENRYRDEPLFNDSTYCYLIEAIGAYTGTGLKAPLINFSQAVCGIPNDTIAPCVPDLVINNFCLDENLDNTQFVNYLTWSFPDDCPQTDDIVAFYIYYSPTTNGELIIIDTVTGFSYSHMLEDSTLTGCYVIQGVDETGNVGSLEIRTCVEDCPDYELPTAFTPNGDGQNDVYTPIIPYQLVIRVDMKIFNRWGNLVFETTDPDINWDGTDMSSGKPLDTAVFFYVCKLFINSLNGLTEVQKPLEGYIHLYR